MLLYHADCTLLLWQLQGAYHTVVRSAVCLLLTGESAT